MKQYDKQMKVYEPAKTGVAIDWKNMCSLKTTMEENFHALCLGQMDGTEAYIQSLKQNQEADGFWCLLPGRTGPADARIDFLYQPTYLACGFLIKHLLVRPAESSQIPEYVPMLSNGLKASIGRKFLGAFGDVSVRIDTLALFIQAGLHEFLKMYPTMCPDFTEFIRDVLVDLKCRMSEGTNLAAGVMVRNAGLTPEYRGDISMNAIPDELKAKLTALMDHLSIMDGSLVFVYGTLMKGQANHRHFLADAFPVGDGKLYGYSPFHLGSYPGIKQDAKGQVLGELYWVNDKTLSQMDILEGNGSLYDRISVDVLGNQGHAYLAQTYEYRGKVKKENKMELSMQPWNGRTESDDVWYACYGSNLSIDRFMRYINQCSDMTRPRESRPIMLPHQLYFAQKCRSWEGKGTAFLNPMVDTSAVTYGRLYRITRKQFDQVKKFEGPMYTHEMKLGNLYGMPICTFTSPVLLSPNPPCDAYLDVIRTGLAETWPELGKEVHESYLQKALMGGEL